MKRYKGLGRVFSFTLTQQLRQRGWRTATIAVALACLLIPILSLTVAAQHQKNAAPEQNPVMEEGYTQEALEDNGQTYMAFFPTVDDETDEAAAEDFGLVILKSVTENGEELLTTLDSDEELQRVYDLFMEQLMDEDDENS